MRLLSWTRTRIIYEHKATGVWVGTRIVSFLMPFGFKLQCGDKYIKFPVRLLRSPVSRMVASFPQSWWSSWGVLSSFARFLTVRAWGILHTMVPCFPLPCNVARPFHHSSIYPSVTSTARDRTRSTSNRTHCRRFFRQSSFLRQVSL